jgi:hypothetical protein
VIFQKSCETCSKDFIAERETRRFCCKSCAAKVTARAGAAVTNYGPNAKTNKIHKRAVYVRSHSCKYRQSA